MTKTDLCLSISDALPVPSDQDLYDTVEKALDKSTGILEGLRAYTGATEPIREVGLELLSISYTYIHIIWYVIVHYVVLLREPTPC